MSETQAAAAALPHPEGFDYIQLSEVDPTFKPVPESVYTLKIMKAEKKEFTYKTTRPKAGVTAGDIGQMVKLTLVIVGDPDFSGRRLFPALFFGNRELRTLRRLMDATGVPQEPGTSFDDWLRTLGEVQPEFKTKVVVKDQISRTTGLSETVNDIDWSTIYPAA